VRANSIVKEQNVGRFERMITRIDTLKSSTKKNKSPKKKMKFKQEEKQNTDAPPPHRSSVNERGSDLYEQNIQKDLENYYTHNAGVRLVC
jgi:hypothetical protein